MFVKLFPPAFSLIVLWVGTRLSLGIRRKSISGYMHGRLWSCGRIYSGNLPQPLGFPVSQLFLSHHGKKSSHVFRTKIKASFQNLCFILLLGGLQSSAGPRWPQDLHSHVFLGECRPEGQGVRGGEGRREEDRG